MESVPTMNPPGQTIPPANPSPPSVPTSVPPTTYGCGPSSMPFVGSTPYYSHTMPTIHTMHSMPAMPQIPAMPGMPGVHPMHQPIHSMPKNDLFKHGLAALQNKVQGSSESGFKSFKWLLLVLVVLGALGYGAYRFYKKKCEENATKQNTTTPIAPHNTNNPSSVNKILYDANNMKKKTPKKDELDLEDEDEDDIEPTVVRTPRSKSSIPPPSLHRPVLRPMNRPSMFIPSAKQVQQFMHKMNQMDHVVRQWKEENKTSLQTMGTNVQQLNKDIEALHEQVSKQNQHINAQQTIIKRLLACTKNDDVQEDVTSNGTTSNTINTPPQLVPVDRSNATLVTD